MHSGTLVAFSLGAQSMPGQHGVEPKQLSPAFGKQAKDVGREDVGEEDCTGDLEGMILHTGIPSSVGEQNIPSQHTKPRQLPPAIGWHESVGPFVVGKIVGCWDGEMDGIVVCGKADGLVVGGIVG